MNIWDRKVAAYERVILIDRELSYDEIVADLGKVIPRVYGMWANMGRTLLIRDHAKRLSKEDDNDSENLPDVEEVYRSDHWSDKFEEEIDRTEISGFAIIDAKAKFGKKNKEE